MALITLFSFQKDTTTRITIYRDDTNPTHFDYDSFTTPPLTPGHPPEDIMVSSACYGTTRYKYYYKDNSYYVRYETEINSTVCGYEPPPCDIAIISYSVTDETEIGANDGTINIFATSSFGSIMYYCYNADNSFENATGYFTGLPPGTYNAFAQDERGCTAGEILTVQAFDNTLTHWKYKFDFKSLDENVSWQLRLYDKRNNYDATEYPKDVEGSDEPVIIKQADTNEDKTTTIISKNLEINLIYDGITFTTEEFTLADAYKWFVQLYKDGELEFQGWLLPDEIQDLYSDPQYEFQLTATDGIPSLKGNSWGNGTGGNGYSDSQVQQYGLFTWISLFKQCLDQLGYNYGNCIFVSSLRYNSEYNASMWSELGCWGDLLYNDDGTAIDTYSALETLLAGLKLCIFQHKGKFILINWNDLFYINNSFKVDEYYKSYYEIALGTGIINGGVQVEQPLQQLVGYNAPLVPINPVQSLTYDKAYNIKADVDFNILALLYPNPSFEIGAVEGDLPSGWSKNNSDISAFTHYGDAYDGDWVFRIQWNYQLALRYAFLDGDGIFIDQTNKKANFSVMWRSGNKPPSGYITIAYRMIFKVQSSGNVYIFLSTGSIDDPTPRWIAYTTAFFTNSKVYITDLIGWNSHTVISAVFPEDGIGWLNIWLNAPQAVDEELNLVGNPGEFMIIDYDSFELSVSDANEQYSKQIGEIHTTTAVTGIPQANQKPIDLGLFTYPPNKRIAGNIFANLVYGEDPYMTGEVGNKWNFALKTSDALDRLPATVTKAIARNYSRPMYIFEGEVQANYVQFYGTFILTWYESRVFIARSIELDCRNSTAQIILIEISDEDAQFSYNYTAKYERNSRRNISN